MSMNEDVTNPVEPQADNLDDFAAEFFGENTGDDAGNAKPEVKKVDDPAESDATGDSDKEAEPSSEDTDNAQQIEDPDTLATDDSEEDEPEEPEDSDNDADDDGTPEEKPKKKSRFQERIDELTASARAAERERDAALQELEKSKLTTKDEQEPKAKVSNDNSTEGLTPAPSPADKNEDGTDKYPLGEYDPEYLKATVQHMFDEKSRQDEQARQEAQRKASIDAESAKLQTQWNEKLSTAQERYPDFQEKGQQMLSVFQGIDESYGDYLTTTIMEMDAGPDVFYHLATNIEEAQKIVSAGPKRATMELAKLELRLSGDKVEKPKASKKVTKAPAPPPQNKGSAVAKAATPLDTDDLEAFSRELFKK